ncbi:amidase [Enterovirga rhinocerotis]|uniref:Asp-tRNA(Asn)/Glu-tRNA(Gln) amidotransferase A subunit family amidase n=1 Tax=Enterovirga rhinocerotis TaxID=1339210 RepID=A0A4R7C4H4_9HYPH|nr:amidase [Enterovirga rhinocerotis]TDR93440.1 Asp-tRNA(Asn)/Glu-tRNA(Gln) amidotransferase A subunit family amidase [Enterovirga rhinocerotis]
MQSITALRTRIRSGDLTPDGALALTREAIAAREPEIGAFVTLAPEPRAQREGPLAGIAVAVKDIIDTADMPTQMGSAIYEGWRPKGDATVVAALRRAGATIIGKSTTTAFASADPTRTRNPHRSGRTPGGSSAGSAAAVGGGMVPLSLGTQTGGSIIRPASFCGAAAIKPSFRLIPTVGVKCLAWTLDTVGLFAATVPDLAAALEAVAGRAVSEGQTRPPRFGVVRQDFAGAPDPEAEAALAEAIARVSRAGADVRDLAVPSSIGEGWEVQPTIMDYESAQSLAWESEVAGNRLPPNIAAGVSAGRATAPADYDEARRTANRARREAKVLFAEVDAILTYSAPGIAPDGHGSTGDPRYNRLWTLLGTPCVNVPGLRGPDDMPIGIQVVAPFARDAVALDAAAFVEAAIAP